MSFLDRIRDCNQCDPVRYLPFRVEGRHVGWVLRTLLEPLRAWPDVFQMAGDQLILSPSLLGLKARSEAVARVCRQLVADGVVRRIHGERYPVAEVDRLRPLLLIDRACATPFGVRAYGQHLNGYVRSRGEIKLWVARRAKDKPTFPGMLDNLVAGGLPYGLALADNLTKECWEEAAIPPALAARAVPTGAVSYYWETDHGLKPDVMFTYDLELPKTFTPRCTDGEVESFELWNLDQVAEVVQDTREFKPNCNLVIIDFLIRHGVIDADDPDYLALTTGLHRPLALATLNAALPCMDTTTTK